ncbi:SCO6880 family protein [Occultella glacieicola]|uniref:SCO6880 family protein n=1 Tax=Occultella glacieicola TaxID=2518684 RepID=UPI001404D79A|nr:SCO6880 family protein [Occultella glacieicola]
MAAAETQTARTYGNWRRPSTAGLGTLGLLATFVLFGGLIAIIVAMMVGGWQVALPLGAAVLLAVIVLAFRDRHGMSPAQRLAVRLGWWRTRRLGSHLYRSGPLGRVPWGTAQLPGLAAASRLSEHTDSYGRPFGLLYVPATGHYTIVISTEPDGAALVDTGDVDQWVAQWGVWLAALGDEPGLVGASVTVESAPDSGYRLRHEVSSNLDPNAPAIAQAMLREVAETWPLGSATIRAWVALTFTASPRPGGRRRSADDMGRELAARVPGLTQLLSATGAGICRPVSAKSLCEVVRVAYDPPAERLLDQARDAGEEHDLRWSDVGPSAAQAGWDYYRHDGSVSVSWSMTSAPRGVVQSSVLARLIGPHAGIARKRVTMLYRPVDPGTAARLVEADKRNADVRASGARPSARAAVDKRIADIVAVEEAAGAGLVNFGMILTATVEDGPELETRIQDAKAAIDNLTATARLTLRPVYGSQDSAFAAALPLGLILPAHLSMPTFVREAAR